MKRLILTIKLIIVILALPLVLANYSRAEQIDNYVTIFFSEPVTYNSEVALLHQFIDVNEYFDSEKNYSEAQDTRFLYTKSEDLEIKKESIKKEDILKAVPSISTEDNKTLGLLIPPFAYFAKRF